jgi:hypothetical protein
MLSLCPACIGETRVASSGEATAIVDCMTQKILIDTVALSRGTIAALTRDRPFAVGEAPLAVSVLRKFLDQ